MMLLAIKFPRFAMHAFTVFIATAFLAMTAAAVEPANASWFQFRGPTGQGTSDAVKLPTEFGLKQGLVWQTPIEGKGWSSPVVAGNHIWLTSAVTIEATAEQREARLANVQMSNMKEVAGSVKLFAICLDLQSGSIIHHLLLSEVAEPQPIHSLNSYASPTPAIDGDRVYCHFGTYGTWCLNESSGDVIWNRQLVIDHSVGPGGSPMVADDVVLLVCDGIDVQYVSALDKMTGEEVWRTPRPSMRATNGEFQKAYSTPLMIQVNGVKQAVIPGAQWIIAYDPATGKEIWRVDHGNGFSISSTPVYTGTDESLGLVIFTTGYGQSEALAIRPDGEGDVTLSHVAWRTDRNVPEKPSPVAVGDLVYMIDDSGVLSCLSIKDASVVFRKRVPGNFSASPLLAGGHLYFSNQEGVVTIIKQRDEYEEVAEIKLDSRLMASPAVVGEDLLFRSETSLMRFTSDK